MKTSAEYRALAWKELRTKFKQSSIIVCASIVMGVIAMGLLLSPLAFVAKQSLLVNYCIILAMLIILIMTIGLLSYYLPIWYLSLVRTQEVDIAGSKCRYGRALSVVVLMMIPSFILGVVNAISKHTDEKYAIIMLLLLFATYAFILWWAYAVNHTLPLIVHDHRELSVGQAFKQSIAIMKGHKWALFKVDLRILLWPVLLLFILAIALGIMWMLPQKGGSVSSFWVSITAICFIVLMLVSSFVLIPMSYFARAHFYEDLLVEQSSAPQSAITE